MSGYVNSPDVLFFGGCSSLSHLPHLGHFSIEFIQQTKERQVSAMQEDVLGTRRTAISETYVNCARCGKATRLRYARVIQSDVLSDSNSEFEYLCPECQKALAEGEKDLPLA
jgi:DNA-directed RNA polymerase subunit RPC12/RpoP